jgi:hypothetical protein
LSTPNPQKLIKQLSANDPAIEKWMWDAAHDIDGLIGLTRFDLAITWAAGIIAQHYAKSRPKADQSSKPSNG